MEPNEQSRQCILVLGMHRSGTSALTRVFGLLGASLPGDAVGESNSNKTGHWESWHLIKYHERLLEQLDATWRSWHPLNITALPKEQKAKIKKDISSIVEDRFGHGPLIVIKEPRICRFAELFMDALEDADFEIMPVLTFRNPLEVVRSLARRNGLSEAMGALIWLRYILDAELSTRHKVRSICSYQNLLSSWRGLVTGVAEDINITWPQASEEVESQIDAFLSSGIGTTNLIQLT